MLVFIPESKLHFPEYGISIPTTGTRAGQVYEALSGDPVLAPWLRDALVNGPVPEISPRDLERAHDPAYVARALSDDPESVVVQTYELYDEHGRPNRYDPEKSDRPLRDFVEKNLKSVAGTHLCAALALENGFTYFLGGGMHHAIREGGRGFCMFNDIVVSLKKLRAENSVDLVWVIDIDAHRGDGTAALLCDDDRAKTLSIHMAKGWPMDLPVYDEHGALAPWRWPGDVDVPIPVGGEPFYIKALKQALELLETLSFGETPDLAYVVGGADPYEHDELESARLLQMSAESMLERDRLVYDFLAKRAIPQAWLMSGGYGARAWETSAQFLQWVLPRRRK